MKRSVNLRRKPRSASANDLLATFRRLGVSDDEIKAELLKMKSAQQSVQRTCAKCGNAGKPITDIGGNQSCPECGTSR